MTATSVKRPASDTHHEPNGKRVRFGGAEDDGFGGGETHDVLKAREVVELRLVTTPKEVSISHARGKQAKEKTFHPKYLHQIFPDEKIPGYSHAKLGIYYDPVSLFTCMFEKSTKLSGEEVCQFGTDNGTPLNAKLAQFIKSGLCGREEFIDLMHVRNEFEVPVKNLKMRYSVGVERYGVYKEKLGEENSPMFNFHERIKFFMFVHIESASWIDSLDPRWEIYCIHRLNDKGQPREFVAYATTYPFSVVKSGNKELEFDERVRISQVLVMPQAQGRGHGTRLMAAIYQDAEKRGCLEVTVEDPSHGFRILRDLTDLRRAYGEEILEYKAEFEYGTEDPIIAELRKQLRITKTQARRCMEVHAMVNLDFDDEDMYKKYRLWVKRRLYSDYVDVLEHLGAKEKKVKLAELYNDTEAEYRVVIKRLETRGAKMPALEEEDAAEKEKEKETITK